MTQKWSLIFLISGLAIAAAGWGIFGWRPVFSGVSQSEEFMDAPKQWLMETHRSWGVATVVGLWLWTLICYYRPAQKYARLWGVVMAAIITVTGILGGQLANG